MPKTETEVNLTKKIQNTGLLSEDYSNYFSKTMKLGRNSEKEKEIFFKRAFTFTIALLTKENVISPDQLKNINEILSIVAEEVLDYKLNDVLRNHAAVILAIYKKHYYTELFESICRFVLRLRESGQDTNNSFLGDLLFIHKSFPEGSTNFIASKLDHIKNLEIDDEELSKKRDTILEKYSLGKNTSETESPKLSNK